MIELGRCPFCGVVPDMMAENKRDTGFTVWVQCPNCNARTEGYCPKMSPPSNVLHNIEECKTKAAKKWNTRFMPNILDCI